MGMIPLASKLILAKAVFLALLTMLCAGFVVAQDSQKSKKVLILFTHQSDQPGQVIVEKAMRSTLESGTSVPIEIYAEYLDAVRMPLDGHEKELVAQLQRKYSNKNFDLIYAVNPPALKLLLENRSAFFPDTPIVYLVLNQQNVNGLDSSTNMTGVWGEVSDKSNVELALALHPGTKRVVVISGVGEWDNYWRSHVQEELRALEGRIEVSYLTGLTVSELKKTLAALPPQSLVLFVSSTLDHEGNSPGNLAVLREICPASSAPVYGNSDAQLGLGIVGGDLLSFEALGAEGARVGTRVMAGEKPEAIAPHGIPNVPMFDWRQLQRWGISEDKLPQGSIVQFKQPTVWEEYKWYAIGLVVAVIVETLLIAWLLFLRLRRRQAEGEAARLGGRLTEIVANVPGIVWESRTDPATKRRTTTFISDYVYKMLGYTSDEWLKEPPGFGLKLVPEAERERVRRESDEVVETGKETVSEFRWLTKDGRIRWVENYIAPLFDNGNRIVGLRGVALDVTERKAAEEALRESESFNRTILASLNTHVCVLDADGRIISVNDSWAAFALDNGLSSEASVGPGVNYLDVCRRAAVEGDSLAQFALDGVRAVCDGTEEYFQLEYPCHSLAEKRWFLMIVTPLKGSNGGAVVVHNDITDSKLAAEAVRESEERFRNMAETAPVMIWMSDEKQATTYVNKQWLELTGSTLEQEIGSGWSTHVHPDDVSSTVECYTAAFNERVPFELEFRVRRIGGEYRWVFTAGAPRFSPDDEFLGYIGTAIDITERKSTEEALKSSELRLRMAQHAARVGTWEWDIKTGVSVWSEMIWELLGLEPNDQDITVDTFADFIHSEDRESVLRKIYQVIADGAEYQDEFRVIRADGSILWLASKGAIIRSDDGEPERVLGVNIDITELKRTQLEAQEISGRLITAQEHERARLARELHDDLSQSIALLSVQLSRLSNEPKDLAFVKDQLNQFVSDVERLAGDLHRISHELHPAKLTQLGLEAALNGFCRELANLHPLEIEFEASDLPRDLPQDVSLCLYRVAQESLQNVIKHSGAASVAVTVAVQNGMILLSISDDGNGFDPLAEKAKEALGLISIDERVRAVNGEAKIISKIGSGTKIEVRVPVGIGFDDGSNNGKGTVNNTLTI